MRTVLWMVPKEAENLDLGTRGQVQIPALPLSSHGTSGRSSGLSEPSFLIHKTQQMSEYTGHALMDDITII